MDNLDPFRHLPMLADLGEQELAHIVSTCETTIFEDGTIIVEEGTDGEGLYVIDKGSAKVLKAIRGEKYQVIADLHPGDHFGEMSLITQSPTSASIRAEGEVSCLFIPKQQFIQLIDTHPSIGRKVLLKLAQTLSNRLVETDRRWARTLAIRNRSRVVWHLLRLALMEIGIICSYLWVWLRKKLKCAHSPQQLQKIHRKNARRFRETACTLKGANVKMGQLASLQAHLLPKEVIEDLRSMRDQVTPTEYSLIAGLIQSELGVGPLDLFREFNKTPIASASMGQVHLARLTTGEQVVVKTLHPGLEQSVRIDLWLIRNWLRVLRFFFKKIDFMQLYRELEAPLLKELDLLHEASATEKIALELKPLGVKVPKVYWQYSTKKVLTLEYIEGTNLDNLAQINAWKVDRTKLAQTYMRSFLHQALLGGFFHCDPHPANAFCTPDGELALLDFGMVKQLPEVIRMGLFKEVLGGFFNNPKLYADGIIERGMIDESERRTLEGFAKDVFADANMRSAIFDHDLKRDGDMKTLTSHMSKLIESLKTFKTPQDELMFLRALAIVIDVCKEIVPETPVSQIVTPVIMPIFTDFLQHNPQYIQLAQAIQQPPG